jgi:hypothetical protein
MGGKDSEDRTRTVETPKKESMSMKLTVSGSLVVLTLALASISQAQSWDPFGKGDRETFRWRGRVDGSDDIFIHGNSVRVEHISANPIQKQDYRFSAPLPSGDVDVELQVIKGRGDVRLLEQPSRRNQYTAVVRVDDQDNGGDSDYEFELSWSRKESKDSSAYNSVFRWRGKVDIGCEIAISGNQHREKDAGGSGTQVRSATFSEPLPKSDVPLSVNKRSGRGKVELIQTPSASNGYTAIVRIDDNKGGADDYDFELRWPRQ